MEKKRDSSYKLHWERFDFEIGKEFFKVRTINHWNPFPRGIVAFSLLESFSVQLHRGLGNFI